MTDKDKAETYIKDRVCIKLCPIWKAHNESCDLFPQCHYIASKIKYYRLGFTDGKKEALTANLDVMACGKNVESSLGENYQNLESKEVSDEAEQYCLENVCRHCIKCDGYGCEEFCDEYHSSLKAFDAGMEYIKRALEIKQNNSTQSIGAQ